MDIEILKGFIKPELLILIPVLYLVGMGLKKSNIKDAYIPFILGASGIILSILWVFAASNIVNMKDILLAAFSSITQGIICAGASVYVNQLIKQAGKSE